MAKGYAALVESEPIEGLPSTRIYGPFSTSNDAWKALKDGSFVTQTGKACDGWLRVGVLPIRNVETLPLETP